ncbi:nuclear pore complex protein Nup98-Nup96 [Pelomyxa schiedti]|nr:nuclear pore complex protein Nup98-Nup96 [Pelomyxa schiedti]
MAFVFGTPTASTSTSTSSTAPPPMFSFGAPGPATVPPTAAQALAPPQTMAPPPASPFSFGLPSPSPSVATAAPPGATAPPREPLLLWHTSPVDAATGTTTSAAAGVLVHGRRRGGVAFWGGNHWYHFYAAAAAAARDAVSVCKCAGTATTDTADAVTIPGQSFSRPLAQATVKKPFEPTRADPDTLLMSFTAMEPYKSQCFEEHRWDHCKSSAMPTSTPVTQPPATPFSFPPSAQTPTAPQITPSTSSTFPPPSTAFSFSTNTTSTPSQVPSTQFSQPPQTQAQPGLFSFTPTPSQQAPTPSQQISFLPQPQQQVPQQSPQTQPQQFQFQPQLPAAQPPPQLQFQPQPQTQLQFQPQLQQTQPQPQPQSQPQPQPQPQPQFQFQVQPQTQIQPQLQQPTQTQFQFSATPINTASQQEQNANVALTLPAPPTQLHNAPPSVSTASNTPYGSIPGFKDLAANIPKSQTNQPFQQTQYSYATLAPSPLQVHPRFSVLSDVPVSPSPYRLPTRSRRQVIPPSSQNPYRTPSQMKSNTTASLGKETFSKLPATPLSQKSTPEKTVRFDLSTSTNQQITQTPQMLSTLSPIIPKSSTREQIIASPLPRATPMKSIETTTPSNMSQPTSTPVAIKPTLIPNSPPPFSPSHEEENEPLQHKFTLSPEYYTIPPVDELNRMTPDELEHLSTFEIGKKGSGRVVFSGPDIDITGLDLCATVVFEPHKVTLYPGSRKPPIGFGLNREAEVTLEGCLPSDPAHSNSYARKLARSTQQFGATLKSYNPLSGSWVFIVSHF